MAQNCKIYFLKSIDLVDLPPRKWLKKVQLNRRIIKATLFNVHLVNIFSFLFSLCPTINIIPYDEKKGNNCKTDA